MVSTETLEGTINGAISYHYDVADDVLYLRIISELQSDTLGEENDEGIIELRVEGSGQLVGLTIVNWWKRFGQGALPDSIRQIESHIDRWSSRIASTKTFPAT